MSGLPPLLAVLEAARAKEERRRQKKKSSSSSSIRTVPSMSELKQSIPSTYSGTQHATPEKKLRPGLLSSLSKSFRAALPSMSADSSVCSSASTVESIEADPPKIVQEHSEDESIARLTEYRKAAALAIKNLSGSLGTHPNNGPMLDLKKRDERGVYFERSESANWFSAVESPAVKQPRRKLSTWGAFL